MSTEHGEEELEYHMDREDISYVNATAMLREQEWRMHKHIQSETRVGIPGQNVYESKITAFLKCL